MKFIWIFFYFSRVFDVKLNYFSCDPRFNLKALYWVNIDVKGYRNCWRKWLEHDFSELFGIIFMNPKNA